MTTSKVKADLANIRNFSFGISENELLIIEADPRFTVLDGLWKYSDVMTVGMKILKVQISNISLSKSTHNPKAISCGYVADVVKRRFDSIMVNIDKPKDFDRIYTELCRALSVGKSVKFNIGKIMTERKGIKYLWERKCMPDSDGNLTTKLILTRINQAFPSEFKGDMNMRSSIITSCGSFIIPRVCVIKPGKTRTSVYCNGRD